jgi:hypothetical protein
VCFVIARVPKKRGIIESTTLNIRHSGHCKKHPINAIAPIDAHVAARYFQFHRVKFLKVIISGGKAFASAVAVGTSIVTFFLLAISASLKQEFKGEAFEGGRVGRKTTNLSQ